MKKILSLAVLILLTWSQSSFATDNKWFKQQQVEEPKQEQPPKTLPPGQKQNLSAILRAPCGSWKEMQASIMKYREQLLFNGSGLTFGPKSEPYNGAMMFFVNQETGTWTMLQVYQDGVACMVFNGKNFSAYGGAQPYGEDQ